MPRKKMDKLLGCMEKEKTKHKVTKKVKQPTKNALNYFFIRDHRLHSNRKK